MQIFLNKKILRIKNKMKYNIKSKTKKKFDRIHFNKF